MDHHPQHYPTHYITDYTIDSGNSYLLPDSLSEPGNSDLLMATPFPSNSLFSAFVITTVPVDPGDALLLDSRPKKKNAAPRRRTLKGTPTPIAALSPVERPAGDEGEDEAIAGFEVALSVKGLVV